MIQMLYQHFVISDTVVNIGCFVRLQQNNVGNSYIRNYKANIILFTDIIQTINTEATL